jgi:hypothetical protein
VTDQPLLIIIPSRGRPEAVAKVVEAWSKTGAWQVAEPLFVIDLDDPRHTDYRRELVAHGVAKCRTIPKWQPMVAKLDLAAIDHARYFEHRHIGFAGDDHLPRTPGWAQDMVGTLDAMGTGIVYPDDGHKHERLASSWAMTADIIRALGRMVPAPVEHLYCDNSVMDLGRAVGRLTYLPGVLVEHMNPYCDGKAPTDEQYERVNGRDQYRKDRPAYKRWRQQGGLQRDARVVADLIKGNVNV